MAWFARYLPGLHIDVDGQQLPISLETVGHLTPEETDALKTAGEAHLRGELEERFLHTRVIAGARR